MLLLRLPITTNTIVPSRISRPSSSPLNLISCHYLNGSNRTKSRHFHSPTLYTRTAETPKKRLICFNYNTSASHGNGTNYLELTDDELMRQCEMDTFKASGPGGQHRNKRESAVRLKHLPTGIIAQVTTSFTCFILCQNCTMPNMHITCLLFCLNGFYLVLVLFTVCRLLRTDHSIWIVLRLWNACALY
jgi:hypothetical protein